MMWLGVDGGGTKTEFVLFDEEMRPRERFRLGTCHPGQVGYDGMTAALGEGVGLASAAAGAAGDTICGVGLGLAGYGQDPAIRARMAEAVRAAVGDVPTELMSDVEAAWASTLGLRDGAVVICGTGSIAFGRRGDETTRAGGWGYQVGDEGSGYWIGHEVLRLFSRQADGRDPRGALFDTVMRELEFSAPYDVITYAHDVLAGDRTRTASLTRVLRAAADAGDPAALACYQRVAAELADIVRAVVEALYGRDAVAGGLAVGDGAADTKIPVGYVGGVFEGAGEFLLEPLARALPAGCALVAPAYEPAAGPCLMLRCRLGVSGPADRAEGADAPC